LEQPLRRGEQASRGAAGLRKRPLARRPGPALAERAAAAESQPAESPGFLPRWAAAGPTPRASRGALWGRTSRPAPAARARPPVSRGRGSSCSQRSGGAFDGRPREAKADSAAARALAPRAQVSAAGVAGGRWRGAPVLTSSLPDDEKRAEPHDQLPGGQDVPGAPLLLLSADPLALEELHPRYDCPVFLPLTQALYRWHARPRTWCLTFSAEE
ncbi:unnamed protein product, partial [Ixodes persulcatus]